MSETKYKSVNIRTMDHITLVVTDLDRSRKFYEELLGMEVVARPDFPFPGLWFQIGGQQIHMNVTGQEAGSAGLPPFDGDLPSRGFHFAFEVDSCDEAAECITSQGLEIVTGPRSRPDGARQLYIYDPDGYLVELYSNV